MMAFEVKNVVFFMCKGLRAHLHGLMFRITDGYQIKTKCSVVTDLADVPGLTYPKHTTSDY